VNGAHGLLLACVIFRQMDEQVAEHTHVAASAQRVLMLQMQQQAEEGTAQLAAARRQCAMLQRQAATDRCRWVQGAWIICRLSVMHGQLFVVYM